jgi:hypothetical protein
LDTERQTPNLVAAVGGFKEKKEFFDVKNVFIVSFVNSISPGTVNPTYDELTENIPHHRVASREWKSIYGRRIRLCSKTLII